MFTVVCHRDGDGAITRAEMAAGFQGGLENAGQQEQAGEGGNTRSDIVARQAR